MAVWGCLLCSCGEAVGNIRRWEIMAHRHEYKVVSSLPADSRPPCPASSYRALFLQCGLGFICFDCLMPLQTHRAPVLSCSFYWSPNALPSTWLASLSLCLACLSCVQQGPFAVFHSSIVHFVPFYKLKKKEKEKKLSNVRVCQAYVCAF